MLLFTTVLFIDGNPVGYEVYRDRSKMTMNPAENPNREIKPPVISAKQTDGGWLIEGTENKDLIDQVVEDLNIYTAFPLHRFTAAP